MDTQPTRELNEIEVETCGHGIEMSEPCVRCNRPAMVTTGDAPALEQRLADYGRSLRFRLPDCAEGECQDRVMSLTLEAGEGSIKISTCCIKCGKTLEATVKISGPVIDYAYSCQHNDEPFDWSKLNPALCADCPHDPHRPGCCAHCKCGEVGKESGSMRRMQASLDRATNLDAEIVDAAVLFVQARIARAKAQDDREALLTSETCSRPELLLCGSGPEKVSLDQYCSRCRRVADLYSAFKAASALQRKHARKLQKLVEKRAR